MANSNDFIISFFAQYIQKEVGIIYDDHNRFQLESRLEEVIKLTGISSIENLYEQCKVGITGAVKQILLDVATNNETSFFRDSTVFNALNVVVFNKLLQMRQGEESLRIWSAASSTGQELISLSILIHEFHEHQRKSFSYYALGTDISERVLAKAKSGMYTQLEIQRGLPGHYLDKYFTKNLEGQWAVSSQLMHYLEFKKLNLKDPFTFQQPFHLILCRNVLIYQNPKEKTDILYKLTRCLLPGGFLVLGVGEGLLEAASLYDQQNIEGTVFYQKK